MSGVWLVLTLVMIFGGLPAILGTYLATEYGNPRMVQVWVTFMVISLAVMVALTAVVMFIA